jgi:hypothetical protein
MAITFSELLTKVREYTEVNSTVLTDSIIEGFITDTEITISRAVDGMDVDRKYATSIFTAGNRYLVLPGDLLYLRGVQVFDSTQSGSPSIYLEKREQTFISEYTPQTTPITTGVPKYYAYWDEDPNHIVVAPAPSSAFTAQINYIKTPQHLSASNTTTWLSTYAQNLLFYGVMTEAFGYLKGPVDMYNTYKNRYTEELKTFGIFQKGYRRRDDYTDGVTQIKLGSVPVQ